MQRSTTTITPPRSKTKSGKLAVLLAARANSARANLQSHPCFQSSLFNDKDRAAGSFKVWKERLIQDKLPSIERITSSTEVVNRAEQAKEYNKDYELQNVIWAESVKQPRRLTITNAQSISDWQIIMLKRQKSYAVSALGELKGKDENGALITLEEKLSLDSLGELRIAFDEANIEGDGQLDLEEFKEVVKLSLKSFGRNDEEITKLFMKIDFSSDGKITWEEFCTFMQLNFTEKEDMIKRSKEVIFSLPARIENSPHRFPIQKITCTNDFNFMILSSDGVVTFWTPQGEIKRVKRDIIEKRSILKDKGDQSDAKRTRTKWITDFIVITEFNKIVVGTGDRELQFWELSSFDPYCQLYSLQTVPIRLAYCYSGVDDISICYGDTDGCVNIMKFNSLGESLRLWKTSPLVANMPSIQLDKALEASNVKYIRWKTHDDWIEQILIDRRLNQIISCSNDEQNAVVIGCILPSTNITGHNSANSASAAVHRQSHPNDSNNNNNGFSQRMSSAITPSNNQQQQQPHSSIGNIVSSSSLNVRRRPEVNETVFKVNKGVKTFDFSFEKNLLITGGMDRVVRLYNPYVPSKPIGHLKSHMTPIFYIHLNNEDNRIFTMSIDKCLNVWDLVDQSCLASIRPKSHKITGELQACCYNPKTKSILINTDKVAFLTIKIKNDLHAEVVLSHKEPVTCFLYNKQFKNLVSCTDNGTVKLWDIETGKGSFEYSNAHGDQSITCVTFDDSNRRLITGSRDGLCKIWNFNNGHCIKILQKETNQEINDVKYTKIYNNKFIISVGWDRKINIYDDDMNDIKLFSHPITRWTDDIENGHKEDILCIAKSDSNFLATSSYDGEIIVWNIISGHIYCKLNSPKPINYNDENLDGDLSVNKLIFLNKERFTNKNAAHLISSGPWGMIHFWNVFSGPDIIVRFSVSDKKGTNISKMCLDMKYKNLFAADNFGYIYNWNIDNYAKVKEKNPPELIKMWRAHCKNITSIEYIDTAKVVISSSIDCTIRLWSPDGKYIGTFGQDEIWNLYDEKTFKHPLVPYDVLVDYESLPDHPIFSRRETMQQVLNYNDPIEKEKSQADLLSSISRNNLIDDDAISKKIREMNVPADKIGKRLRHEIMKPVASAPIAGSRNYYSMLKCYDYDDRPTIVKTPSIKLKSAK